MAIRYDEETGQYYDDGDTWGAQGGMPYPVPQPTPTPTPPAGPDEGDPNRNATPEQIAAAERGPNIEGRSVTPDQQRAAYDAAIANGVPADWANEWLSRNPNDENRLEDVWADELNPGGTDPSNTPAQGGSGNATGQGGNQGAFTPPPNTPGWMPTLDLPTWQPPPAFQAPPDFSYGEYQRPADYVPGEFSYEGYQRPADYVPGEFSYGEYHKPADYVAGTFERPTIEQARQEPGFQFALDEGRRQMEASAAAKGIGRTGGTVKRLIGYGQEMADTNYNSVFNRDLTSFNTNEGNRSDAYKTNAALGLGEYNTNRGNAFDNFNLNENNRAGAYRTNADLGYQAWSGNRNNAFENFTTNEGNRKGAYDTNAALGFGAWNANKTNAADAWTMNYGKAKDTYDYGYNSSLQKHNYDTAEAVGEYAPKKTEAEITHQQAFAEWLAKMGIATDIFNEGSD